MTNAPLWFWYKNATNVFVVKNLRNTLLPGFINNATVVCTLTDAATGLALTGGNTWPLTLPYVTGSDGLYRVTLDADLIVTLGQRIIRTYLVTIGTAEREWVQPGLVV